MLEKLKLLLADDTLFTSTLLCVIAVLAFFLGRFSIGDQVVAVPAVTQVGAALVPLVATSSTGTATVPAIPLTEAMAKYVGSKSGTKYHLVTCAGAKRIKDENKIFFVSVEEAEAAGYSPASNCPGL